MKSKSAINSVKGTEQYFPVVLIIMLYKVVLYIQKKAMKRCIM